MVQVTIIMRKVSILSILLCLLLLSFFVSNTAFAKKGGPDVCVGNHSYSTFDNIVVPSGNTCKIDRFNVVSGNIKVEEGASLIICPDNEIKGNIKAEDADTVFISDLLFVSPCSPPGPPKALGITIGGNVDIKGASSFTLLGNPFGVTAINGNVNIKQTQNVRIENFTGIAGNVEVKNNGNVVVTGNTIGGNLKIKGTTGSCIEQNNFVSGKVSSCP